MFNSSGPSVSDIAAVMGNRNNDGNGFNDGGAWWVLIILFALFGWGRNGMGNGNGNNDCCCNGGSLGGFTEAAIQRGFDNQAVVQKLDGISNGICNLGYDQLAQMNGINSNIMQTGFGIQQAINSDTVANMQNTNALSRQLADCCCENRAAIKDLQYNMATQSCATNTNIHQTGDAIIQSQTQGFQMLNNTIRDGFCNLEMREMQRENQALRDRLNNCDRDSALQSMANYIVNSVRPTPTPSWLVQNPWGCCNNNVAAFNNGCNTCNTCCA